MSLWHKKEEGTPLCSSPERVEDEDVSLRKTGCRATQRTGVLIVQRTQANMEILFL
jgi:hypothetical protein